MRLARRVFFLLTCFQAYVAFTAGALMLGSVLSGADASVLSRVITSIIAVVYVSAGLVNGAAAWRMQTKFTRWSWAAAALNLAVVPTGTAFGLLGLYLLSRKDFREFSPAPQAALNHPAVPAPAKPGLSVSTLPVVAALGVTFLCWSWVSRAGLANAPWWVWLLSTEGAILLGTLLHESGHALCGWLSDYELMIFRVGPLRWARTVNGSQFDFLSHELFSWTGHCGMLPIARGNAASRAMFFAAGGPLGSFAAGLMGAAGLLTAHGSAWESAWPFFQCLMTFGMADLVSNLNPLSSAGAFSDTARLRLSANPNELAMMMARNLLDLSLNTSLRPRDWDTIAIVRAAKASAGSPDHLGYLFLGYQMNADRGNAPRASYWMRLAQREARAQDAVPPYAAHFAYHEACAGNAAGARQWFDLAANDGSPAWHRAHAAVTWAEGNRNASRLALQEATAALQTAVPTGMVLFEHDRAVNHSANQALAAALAA